ncbi:MAG TPA: glycosyltransferase [Casimicrobiaceae bacterium]|nr:glycosyltransferase [Casimicrobiaceae bacterium]
MNGPATRAPLVSLIIRSMGRPCLVEALASAARQHHRPLEVIVVDATGGAHPPLPRLRALDALRLVTSRRALNRPAAANLGLESATGEWIAFLDDDDLLEPSHLARLVARASEPDRPRVVYAQHWPIDRLHRVGDQRRHRFNPLIMHFYCRIPGMACLLHWSLARAERFDETFNTCEDWEYWLRLMRQTPFATVREPTHFYFSEAGTSGTGLGQNRGRDDRGSRDRVRVLERHADARNIAWADYFSELKSGEELQRSSGATAAAAFYARMLERYPDEPNASALLGRQYAALAHLQTARRLLLHSIFFNGDAGDSHFALGEVCEALGYRGQARDAFADAARFAPALREAAELRLKDLAAPKTANANPVTSVEQTVSRNTPCPCGSGLRFKACHGRDAPPLNTQQAVPKHGADLQHSLREALEAAQRGEVETALALFTGVASRAPDHVEAQHASALLAWDLGDLETAEERIATAARLAPDDMQIADDHRRICIDVQERQIARELHAKLAAAGCLATREDRLPSVPAGSAVHVIGPFDEVDGERERCALDIARIVGTRASVHVWSTRREVSPALAAAGARAWPADAGAALSSGVLAFCGAQLPPLGLHGFEAHRILVTYDFDDAPLLHDLATMLWRELGQPVLLITPSEALRRHAGLPGSTCAPGLDLSMFAPRRVSRQRAFTVGCVGRSDAPSFHPDNPVLLRRLACEGIGVRVLGGSVLLRHFPPSQPLHGIELLSADEMDRAEFLTTLDCLLHRPAPRNDIVHASVVAQALACGLPVVCACESAAAELVSHGVDGFLFNADEPDQARRYLRTLRAVPALRRRMAQAARAKAEALFGAARDAHLTHLLLGSASSIVQQPMLSMSEA